MIFILQANNAVIDVWGEKLVASPGFKLKNHVDLVELLDIADTKRGTKHWLYTFCHLLNRYCGVSLEWCF